MRFNRKGMVAVMDAMLFIIVLGIAVSVIFVYIPGETQEPLAEKVHGDLFGTELRMDDVFDVNDSRVVPLTDILAAHLSSGQGNIEEYLYNVLRSMTPISHTFVFECEFHGILMTVGESGDQMTSSYAQTHSVAGDQLRSSLTIY